MDVRTFQAFYQQNFLPVYRLVYSKVGNREEAEDLTAEVFLKAMRGINLERDPESMQQWLYLVARTVVADHWRAYYRMPTDSLDKLLEEGWEGPTEMASASRGFEQEERVQRLMHALPGRYREVLTCRFLLNLSIKETALKMGVSEANAKVLQYRALKRAAQLELTVNDQLYQAL